MKYIKQKDSQIDQTCGAAALAMVYDYFGIHNTQSTVWKRISIPDDGFNCTASYKIGKDALDSGLYSIIVRVKNTMKFLESCASNNIQAIFNHRLSLYDEVGHYTVLTNFDKKKRQVTLHDPEFGANINKSIIELNELWTPSEN